MSGAAPSTAGASIAAYSVSRMVSLAADDMSCTFGENHTLLPVVTGPQIGTAAPRYTVLAYISRSMA